MEQQKAKAEKSERGARASDIRAASRRLTSTTDSSITTDIARLNGPTETLARIARKVEPMRARAFEKRRNEARAAFAVEASRSTNAPALVVRNAPIVLNAALVVPNAPALIVPNAPVVVMPNAPVVPNAPALVVPNAVEEDSEKSSPIIMTPVAQDGEGSDSSLIVEPLASQEENGNEPQPYHDPPSLTPAHLDGYVAMMAQQLNPTLSTPDERAIGTISTSVGDPVIRDRLLEHDAFRQLLSDRIYRPVILQLLPPEIRQNFEDVGEKDKLRITISLQEDDVSP